MKRRALLSCLILVFLSFNTPSLFAQDPNTEDIPVLSQQPSFEEQGDTIFFVNLVNAILSGPPDSNNLFISITNISDDRIRFIELSFRDTENRLIFDPPIFNVTPPLGGYIYEISSSDDTPVLILEVMDFDPLETLSFNFDVDTFEDSTIGITVRDVRQGKMHVWTENGVDAACALVLPPDQNGF